VPPPTPVPGPDESTVTAALQAHESDFIGSNFDNLQVSVPDPTYVVVTFEPNAMLNDADVIRMGSADALDVAEAIFASGSFPTVTLFQLQVNLEFINTFGNTTTGVAAWLDFSASTASQFDYAGMQTEPADAAWCDADTYWISPVTWKNLNSGDRGCLTTPSNQ